MTTKQCVPLSPSLPGSPALTVWRVSAAFCLIISATALFSPAPLPAAFRPPAVSVVDFRGKTLTFQQPIRRIVCLIESALSGLYMLDAGQQVVGVSANIYQPPVFDWYAALDTRIKRKQLPAPGNWDFISIEGVIALKPDVVIIWSAQSEAIAALEERGIKVFGVFLQSRQDVYREMLALGTLSGRQARARALVTYTQGELERIRRRTALIPPASRPVIYYLWAQGLLETSCGGSTVDDLITLAGGRNACGAFSREHMLVNLEQVLAWNPALIVMWGNDRLDPADIIADPQWRMIRAVKEHRVHELPEVFLCDLWTLKFAYAVKLLATWCHPRVFAALDLEAERRAMLMKLYGPKLGAF